MGLSVFLPSIETVERLDALTMKKMMRVTILLASIFLSLPETAKVEVEVAIFSFLFETPSGQGIVDDLIKGLRYLAVETIYDLK